MKKQILIFSLLITLFITGCGAQKTELDKFKYYLKKNEDYKCSENICTRIDSIGKLITFTNQINFDINTLTYSSNDNNNLSTTETIYNWVTNTATYHSYTLGVEINATYNFTTEEFNCTSEYEDKEYVETECKVAKLSIKELKTKFEKIITDSATTYFSN